MHLFVKRFTFGEHFLQLVLSYGEELPDAQRMTHFKDVIDPGYYFHLSHGHWVRTWPKSKEV